MTSRAPTTCALRPKNVRYNSGGGGGAARHDMSASTSIELCHRRPKVPFHLELAAPQSATQHASALLHTQPRSCSLTLDLDDLSFALCPDKSFGHISSHHIHSALPDYRILLIVVSNCYTCSTLHTLLHTLFRI